MPLAAIIQAALTIGLEAWQLHQKQQAGQEPTHEELTALQAKTASIVGQFNDEVAAAKARIAAKNL